MSLPELPQAAVKNLVRQALAEDVGSGDATTLAVVPEDQEITAVFRTREDCVVAGMPVVSAIFEELDRNCELNVLRTDGARCQAGDILAKVSGKAQAILTGERNALNFLQRMCGIATVTRRYVDALHSDRTKLLDTRKTTPGLRMLEKYAVACGGGTNHRFGLFDRVMIKDNHRHLAAMQGPGGIKRSVQACRDKFPKLEVEVEADTIEQVEEAIDAGAEYILLDNMSNAEMVECVKLRDAKNSSALLEASGGITLERMPSLAATGVDFISVGALTHSAPSIDIGLDIDEEPRTYPDTP